MILVALRGLWGRKTRAVLTAISIVLGTAMIAGTFVVRDQITGAFDSIFQTGLEKTDVLASKRTAFTSNNGAQAGPLPASLIGTIAHVDGVAKAEGQIQAAGALVVNGKYAGSSSGAPSLVVSSLSDTFNPYTFSAGHAPTASGEVVVNSKLADDKHLKVGQHVQLATAVGLKPVTIVGIFNLGSASSIGGATIVGTTFADAQQWYDRVDQTSTISVKADPGVSQQQLKQRIIAAVPHFVKVQTGPEAAKEQANQVASGINDFLTPLLLAFAGATVFAGAFIIFNTFSITVAQRSREFALLRTIGASRRQVLRSVLIEALVIGLLASLSGIVVGIGFAKLLDTLFDKSGSGLPTSAITLKPLTVLAAAVRGHAGRHAGGDRAGLPGDARAPDRSAARGRRAAALVDGPPPRPAGIADGRRRPGPAGGRRVRQGRDRARAVWIRQHAQRPDQHGGRRDPLLPRRRDAVVLRGAAAGEGDRRAAGAADPPRGLDRHADHARAGAGTRVVRRAPGRLLRPGVPAVHAAGRHRLRHPGADLRPAGAVRPAGVGGALDLRRVPDLAAHRDRVAARSGPRR